MHIWFDNSPAWGVTRQLGFSVAAIVAKTGFSVMTHKVAKLRTALDIEEGQETHGEDVWMSGVRLAGARPALGVFLGEAGEVYPQEHRAATVRKASVRQ